MKAVVHDFHTEVFPTNEEAREVCKVGQDADTCIYFVVGRLFECCYYNRGPILSLLKRRDAGETNAKRDGCERVQKFPIPRKLGECEIP